ncbi:hypothetical protein [Lysinibacillus sp. NPDC093692]|uniref:hypothetical protein n=1 Tax=Lysinibacillus sp. NPDC093692 TaxID=3390578 RepID=UPI003D060005
MMKNKKDINYPLQYEGVISVPTERFVVVVAVASLSSQSNASSSESETLHGADVFCAKAKFLDARPQKSE